MPVCSLFTDQATRASDRGARHSYSFLDGLRQHDT